MSGFPWAALCTNLWVTALVTGMVMLASWAFGVFVRGGRHDGVDVVWGLGFAVVALTTLLVSSGDGDTLLGGSEIAAGLGVLVWLVGIAFESIGDAQLAAFKADPASSGQVMDRGLWRYTRHPNYFGDACVWWGLTLLALHHLPGLLALPSAAVMTFFLVRGTGAKLLESTIGDRRPGYADYISRTSGFVPLPPRRTATPKRKD